MGCGSRVAVVISNLKPRCPSRERVVMGFSEQGVIVGLALIVISNLKPRCPGRKSRVAVLI
jgi:hypothetical protein